eukprot:2422720-Pleurochrysis_carterae.AAC.1
MPFNWAETTADTAANCVDGMAPRPRPFLGHFVPRAGMERSTTNEGARERREQQNCEGARATASKWRRLAAYQNSRSQRQREGAVHKGAHSNGRGRVLAHAARPPPLRPCRAPMASRPVMAPLRALSASAPSPVLTSIISALPCADALACVHACAKSDTHARGGCDVASAEKPCANRTPAPHPTANVHV